MDPPLFKVFAEEFVRETNRLRADGSAERRKQERELQNVTSTIKRLIKAITSGIDAQSVKNELNELKAKKLDLERSMSEP